MLGTKLICKAKHFLEYFCLFYIGAFSPKEGYLGIYIRRYLNKDGFEW